MSHEGRQLRKLLVTVKTYPTPSKHYAETVCVAGIDLDTNEWLRLYPVPFRSLPDDAQFRKYQVVQVSVRKHTQDPRPESYDPDWGSFSVLESIGPEDGWERRSRLIKPAMSPSMCEILRQQKVTGKSLGCFRPAEVQDFLVRDDAGQWSETHDQALRQLRLFQDGPTQLEKIPFKFSYKYRCSDPACPGHLQRLLDWEVYQCCRHARARSSSVNEVKESIRGKFFDELCAPNKDTHFFVGSHSSHFNSFMVLGVFWPPKRTPGLFD